MATAPTLKNKRLSERDRDVLLTFARQQIEATEKRAELDAAYERAADAVHGAVIARWPQKDMKVLARYDAAAADQCVYVSTGGSNYERFNFRDDDKRIPLRPSQSGCRRMPVLLEGTREAAYDTWRAAEKAREAAVRARLNDFKALIYGTPSFNALAEAWPAAETMREKIVGTGTALAVLSSDVINRLKADPALEMAEAA